MSLRTSAPRCCATVPQPTGFGGRPALSLSPEESPRSLCGSQGAGVAAGCARPRSALCLAVPGP